MTRRQTTNTLLFLFAMAAVSAWLGGLFAFTRSMDAMTHPSPPQPLDAIVVLTGGTNRLEEGFHLLEQAAGKKLYISGVYRGVEVKELMALLKQQRPASLECCIELGDAENTVENATETLSWLRAQGYRSFYLVTANYHMKRALLEFERAEADIVIVPWPVNPENMDVRHWWKNESFRDVIMREYTKYLLTLIKPLFRL